MMTEKYAHNTNTYNKKLYQHKIKFENSYNKADNVLTLSCTC